MMRRVGWRSESQRHSLAARGIRTRRYAAKMVTPELVMSPECVHCGMTIKRGDVLCEMCREELKEKQRKVTMGGMTR